MAAAKRIDMTHKYSVSGMTCGSCEAKVRGSLLSIPGITAAEVSKDTATATVSMDKHINVVELQNALGGPGSQYKIAESEHHATAEPAAPGAGWLETYKPVLLIFL